MGWLLIILACLLVAALIALVIVSTIHIYRQPSKPAPAVSPVSVTISLSDPELPVEVSAEGMRIWPPPGA